MPKRAVAKDSTFVVIVGIILILLKNAQNIRQKTRNLVVDVKSKKLQKYQKTKKIKNKTHSRSDLPTLQVYDKQFGLDVLALIDSGAAGNFIGEQCANFHHIPIVKKQHSMVVQLADSSICPNNTIYYETIPLLIYHHVDETIVFDVVPKLNYDIILGVPWLRKHRPSIDWDTLTLNFSSSLNDSSAGFVPVTSFSVFCVRSPSVTGFAQVSRLTTFSAGFVPAPFSVDSCFTSVRCFDSYSSFSGFDPVFRSGPLSTSSFSRGSPVSSSSDFSVSGFDPVSFSAKPSSVSTCSSNVSFSTSYVSDSILVDDPITDSSFCLVFSNATDYYSVKLFNVNGNWPKNN